MTALPKPELGRPTRRVLPAFTNARGQMSEFLTFAVASLAACVPAFRRPAIIVTTTARLAALALPMVLLIGVSLGLVAWLHFGRLLGRFELDRLLPSSLMVAVVLELGPIAIGLVAAGRLATGMAAELAAMVGSEQIDALRCLGVSPHRRLVAPRLMACVILFPLLTVTVDYTALLGSFAAEWLSGQMTWAAYWRASLDHVRPVEAVLATLKTSLFGFLTGLLACWHGLSAPRTTEAVGQAATRALLSVTLAVLMANVLLVRLIQEMTVGHS